MQSVGTELKEKLILAGAVNNPSDLDHLFLHNIKNKVLVHNQDSVSETLEPFIPGDMPNERVGRELSNSRIKPLKKGNGRREVVRFDVVEDINEVVFRWPEISNQVSLFH